MGTITLTSMVLASIVSERRRTEQALHQAREDLRKHAADLELRVQQRTASLQDTFHSLESLCYSIAHDLRAPLRAIAGYTDILGEDYEKLVDERGKEYLWRVKAAAARMDLLILDLLQLGRVGSAEIAPADLQLEPIAQRVLAQMHEEIKSRNAEIHLNKPLLPVFANGALLEQILHNLFANALKFARNETKPRIELWTESRENWVRICVKDNGIGIESEHLERIFQPFEKLTSHPAAQGNGIGLAIVRKGVERMGGRVGVESCPGAGSCFWLELPRPGLTATWTI
jgi:signal transduction histidine kinase